MQLCAPSAAPSTDLQFVACGASCVDFSTKCFLSRGPPCRSVGVGDTDTGRTRLHSWRCCKPAGHLKSTKKCKLWKNPNKLNFRGTQLNFFRSLCYLGSAPHILLETRSNYKFRPCTRAEFKTAPYAMGRICLQDPKFL